MMPQGKYSINDLEKLSGVKAHTIRIWEKRYGLLHPMRTKGNIRYYDNEDLRLLLNISLLSQQGYKISKLSQMSYANIESEIKKVNFKQLNGALEEQFLLCLLLMDEQKFNDAFESMEATYGFELGIVKIIFPFFNRIGIMWQSGAINPGQEHFFSNLIRSKIIVATASLSIEAPKKEKALFFLPELEMHELALLFYNYLFKARGYSTIYLGQSLPLSSLSRIIETCRPDYIITGITNPIVKSNVLQVAHQLIDVVQGAKVFLTGPIPPAFSSQMPPNVFLIQDLLQLLNIQP